MKKLLFVTTLSAALASCAKSPESISASYVSDLPYQSYSCAQLQSEAIRLNAALGTASAQQQQARGNDVAGVLLIGMPVSTLSGDNIAPEVARLKGESEAVRRAGLAKNCWGAASSMSGGQLRSMSVSAPSYRQGGARYNGN